jgi:hypothetical protein
MSKPQTNLAQLQAREAVAEALDLLRFPLPEAVQALGDPDLVFPYRQRYRIWIKLGGLTCLLLGGFFLATTLFSSNSDPQRKLIGSVLGLALLIGAAFAFVLLRREGRSALMLFPDQLVRVRPGHHETYRWDELEVYVMRLEVNYVFRLVAHDGRELRIDNDVSNNLTVGQEVLDRVQRSLRPTAERLLAEGKDVLFGPVRINRSGITYKGETLAWSEAKSVKLGPHPEFGGYLVFWVEAHKRWTRWCSLGLGSIPNFDVFTDIVRQACPYPVAKP